VNEVRASGLTTSQLRKVLEQKYKEFVFNPNVSIRLEDISSNEVFVVGQVTKPGAYPMTGNDTLLQALTRAGGLTIFAARRNVKVVRRDGGKVLEYIADYDAILKGDLSQDITLKPGDRVIVP
jgi:polysaccharide export outer membrane protein